MLCFDNGQAYFWKSTSAAWHELVSIEFGEGGRLENVVAGQKTAPWNLDRASTYVLPGFIDSHVHLGEDSRPRHIKEVREEGFFPTVDKNLKTALLSGITTLRDVGSLGVSVKQFELWKDHKVKSGAAYPRVFSAGSFVTKYGGHGADCSFNVAARLVTNSDEANYWIEFMGRERASFIKVMNDPIVFSKDELSRIVQFSHSQNLPVSVHAYNDDSALMAIECGVDCIEHSSDYSRDVLAGIENRNVFVCTTFVAALDAASSPIRCGVDCFDSTCSSGVFSDWYLSVCRGLPQLWQDNTKIVLGSDAGCAGTDFGSLWREVFAVNALGIGMERCVKAATETPAQLLGLGNDLGKIECGYLADLAIFDGNPLLGRKKPVEVYVGGQLCVKDGKLVPRTP
jgi:imidazolonepropionase-like amidohydrolase